MADAVSLIGQLLAAEAQEPDSPNHAPQSADTTGRPRPAPVPPQITFQAVSSSPCSAFCSLTSWRGVKVEVSFKNTIPVAFVFGTYHIQAV